MKLKVWVALCLALASVSAADAQLTISTFNNLSATVASNGSYTVTSAAASWQIGGSVGSKIFNSRAASGTDNLGAYEEVAFEYSAGTLPRSASIRIYATRPLAMFAVTYNSDSPNTAPFPVLSSYPANLLHLSFNGMFAFPAFDGLLPDSPWIYFDNAANTFIVSPASDYMVAATTRGANGEIRAGISSKIATLPAGMTHRTLVTFGQGINQTLNTWGQALTDLAGKTRPANDADALLKSISYWTDNGATYYYNAGGPSYTDTLRAVNAEFSANGIRLGSMQLDSWWYPKGPDNAWSSHGGIWTYSATSAVFQPDLLSFQTSLGIPLAAHARWIDAASPYRSQYTISGNVATDPQYWEDVAAYLANSGVTIYEQDWLANNAQTAFNLTDPQAFLNNMAASMAKRGITMQYCMATPAHFLQSTNYGNITTIRTSADGFGKGHWTEFLYGSQFAASLGVWPFSDVFLSTERNNLLLATLSAGPVGVGDALGTLAAGNLLHAVRSDGVIVKPDAPITPLDSVAISDAQGIDTPMVASTYSDFGGQRVNYIFAYTRDADAPITIAPATWGIGGPAYLYDYLSGKGSLIPANGSLMLNLNNGIGYYVLAAVSPSGLALLGDKGHFVTMGKKRISSFSDTGVIDVTVSFAAGETGRTLFGYSPVPVTVAGLNGRADRPVWNSATQLFTVRVHPSQAGLARMHVFQAPAAPPMATGKSPCAVRCIGAPPAPINTKVQDPVTSVSTSQQ
jgi:hypothetical protein